MGERHKVLTSAALPARTRIVFVEGIPGHQYLYDLYGETPNVGFLKYSLRSAWRNDVEAANQIKNDLECIWQSIPISVEALFFLSFDPLLFGSHFHVFLRHLSLWQGRTYGILHRMPRTADHIERLRIMAPLIKGVCFLSEIMAADAKNDLRIDNAMYLPHHPITFQYSNGRASRDQARISMGASRNHVVFSVLGEARQGKGIDLVLSSLKYIPKEVRNRIFLLIGGKARDYSEEAVRNQIKREKISGRIDLRSNKNALQYMVLTDREYAQYIALSDVGLLLYQGNQRDCMSGVLGDYVWAGASLLATEHSYVGAEVKRNALGLTVSSESPKDVAAALVKMLDVVRVNSNFQSMSIYREKIAPSIVLRRLREIVGI
jgi:glycosyltransferase involved in cell wall biosynthesis